MLIDQAVAWVQAAMDGHPQLRLYIEVVEKAWQDASEDCPMFARSDVAKMQCKCNHACRSQEASVCVCFPKSVVQVPKGHLAQSFTDYTMKHG